MAAPTETTVANVQERSALATRRFCEALGLDAVKPKDLKNLTVALAEAAAAEVAVNDAFRARVLSLFREMTAKPAPVSARTRPAARPAKPKLVPTGYVDPDLFGPDMPLDPYLLLQLYGHDQLRLALSTYPPGDLKQAVGIVQERHPGTNPSSRSQKASLVDYIVKYVAG